MCRCPKLSLPPLPYVLSGLKAWELPLLVLVILGALIGNVWFLQDNLRRMHEAQQNPVSQLSQRQLTSFPAFAMTTVLGNGVKQVVCLLDQKTMCKSEQWATKKDTYITYSIPEGYFNANQFSVLALYFAFNSTLTASQYTVLYFTATAAEARNKISGFDTHVVVLPPSSIAVVNVGSDSSLSLGVSTTLAVDSSIAAHTSSNTTFRVSPLMSRAYAEPSAALITFPSFYMDFSETVNTLSVVYKWQDVVASSASILSITAAAFSFLFPIRAVAKHTMRCFWRKEGRNIDREVSSVQINADNEDAMSVGLINDEV